MDEGPILQHGFEKRGSGVPVTSGHEGDVLYCSKHIMSRRGVTNADGYELGYEEREVSCSKQSNSTSQICLAPMNFHRTRSDVVTVMMMN